jgi:NADPH:quinone reductase-like Zn-dependent oxidoreductase
MAAGGVGTAVLQLCRTVDGVVTYGTASRGKHDHVRSQGCDHPIDYRSEDYVARVRELTGGRGVDLVLDALGGPDWRKGYALLRPMGMLVAFGLANAAARGPFKMLQAAGQVLRAPWFSPMSLMNENRIVAGCNMGHLWDEVDVLRAEAEALSELYTQGRIAPHVFRSYTFDEVRRAHADLEGGKTVGKVVLVP